MIKLVNTAPCIADHREYVVIVLKHPLKEQNWKPELVALFEKKNGKKQSSKQSIPCRPRGKNTLTICLT